MLRLIWAASVRIHELLRWAPSNLLLNRIRTPRGLRWGIPVMLLAVPLFFTAAIVVEVVQGGGPGWLNLAVIVLVWDAMKLLAMGPLSLILLARARIGHRRQARQGSPMRSQ